MVLLCLLACLIFGLWPVNLLLSLYREKKKMAAMAQEDRWLDIRER